MQISIDKKKMTATIALVLMLTSVTLIANVSVQPVQADEPWMTNQSINVPVGVSANYTTDTIAFLSFTPNVLGVGQQLLVNMWLSPSVNTNRGIYINNTGAFQIIITKPDGTKVTLVPPGYTRSELSSWLQYTPDVVGEYKIMFNFLGTYFPAQFTTWDDQYFRPSKSAEFTFTVQQEMVPSWPPSALPTEYWTWPVDFSHREWWLIMGTWPATGYNAAGYADYFDTLYPGTNPVYNSRHMFIPFVQGPNSAHVLRISTDAIGGLYGGAAGITGLMADSGYPSVVYQGRCYKTVTRNAMVLLNGTYRTLPTSCAECFNLRTGEIYYSIPTADGGVTPTMVMYDRGTSTLSDTETYTIELQAISGNRLYKINPFTGAITTNVSISGLPGTELMNQIDGWVVGIQDLGVAATNLTGGRYRLINWTTSGTSTNIASRVISNTSYARSSLPTLPSVNWDSGYGATYSGVSVSGTTYATNVSGINAYTGVTIWSTIYNSAYYDPQVLICDHGKFSMWTRTGPDTGKQVTWDLATGKLLWESETLSYPWAASGFSVYGSASAYGMLFRPSYAGLYAINWTDGKVVWFCPRYAKANFESAYTEYAGGASVYPGQTQVRIADGKVYIYDGEHSPQQPRVRGWSFYCINVTTGKIIWELPITGGISFGNIPSTGPIVDGYLYFPATTGDTYIFGKGKSATTVTAPDVSVPLGTALTIKGTVLDQSPAQPGTPCVSKDSMTNQMSYLHLQYPIDGIWHNETLTGVPVTLSAIGSDGTYIDIGTATTNGYYGTFSMAWTPPKEDTYTVMANFAADDSYGSSGAATGVTVGPAPDEIVIPPGPEPIDNSMLLYGVLAAVIIAIIVGLAAVLLALRKH